MPRKPRVDIANYYYHVLNRANARKQIFNEPADYKNFEYILFETLEMFKVELVAYCIMPNHWHLILKPTKDGELGKFMNRLTNTHVKQYKSMHDQIGFGHLYQGRYKSFLIGDDDYFYTTLRYVERNALRAGLVEKAQDWQWGSARSRITKDRRSKYLSKLPIDLPNSYQDDLNDPLTESELESLRHSVSKSKNYSSLDWQEEFDKHTKAN